MYLYIQELCITSQILRPIDDNVYRIVDNDWDRILERPQGTSVVFASITSTTKSKDIALDFFDDNPFLVTNSDIFTDFKYEEIIKYQLKDGIIAHLIFVPNPIFKDQGDFGLAGELVNLNRDFTFSGIGIYTKQMFTEYTKGEKIQLKTIFENNIKKNRISGSLFQGYWSDIGTPERLKYENTKYDN